MSSLREKKHIVVARINVAEMRLLRWMFGKTMKDKMRNEHIRVHLTVASIGEEKFFHIG